MGCKSSVPLSADKLPEWEKLAGLYESVRDKLPKSQEKSLKMTELYVHPIRSIRALPVDKLFLGPYGFKYDREFALFGSDDLKIVGAKWHMPILELIQEITYKDK